MIADRTPRSPARSPPRPAPRPPRPAGAGTGRPRTPAPSTATTRADEGRRPRRLLSGVDMLRLGLIGGMSWDETLHREGRWEDAAALLAAAATSRQAALSSSCRAPARCTRSPTRSRPPSTSPFLHVADATADEALAQELLHVGLLGSAFTTEQDFYASRLRGTAWTCSFPPPRTDRWCIGRSTRSCAWARCDTSPARSTSAYHRPRRNRGDGVILGYTEIELLVSPGSGRALGVTVRTKFVMRHYRGTQPNRRTGRRPNGDLSRQNASPVAAADRPDR